MADYLFMIIILEYNFLRSLIVTIFYYMYEQFFTRIATNIYVIEFALVMVLSSVQYILLFEMEYKLH